MSTNMIWTIVLASIAGLALIIGIVMLVRHTHQSQKQEEDKPHEYHGSWADQLARFAAPAVADGHTSVDSSSTV